jgi:hypothetical protein
MKICKGRACALHLTPEYEEGARAKPRSQNPYDFWDEYEKHYAWDIGNQAIYPPCLEQGPLICPKCGKVRGDLCVCKDR